MSPTKTMLGSLFESERFSLVLLRVSSEGQGQIERWLASGASTGSFAGLPQISGSTELGSATGLVLRQPGE